MNAIEIKHFSKTYGNIKAVSDLNLEICEGEIFGLLGVNGAGKTTTIKALCGLVTPTQGELLLYGYNYLIEPEKIKEIINISPQETAIALNLTVYENLEFIASLYLEDKSTVQSRIKEVVESLGLQEVLKQKGKTLSGGWQRKLSIAIALITKPKVLFLDEPTLGLDVLARRELWKIIKSLSGKTTIILTTHYLDEAEALCDRIAIMTKGSLMACGTVCELKKKAGMDKFEDVFVTLATKEVSYE